MKPISDYEILLETRCKLTGNTSNDIKIMNENYGTIEWYTWHHNNDGSMVLVQSDIHSSISHTGGASGYRNNDLP